MFSKNSKSQFLFAIFFVYLNSDILAQKCQFYLGHWKYVGYTCYVLPESSRIREKHDIGLNDIDVKTISYENSSKIDVEEIDLEPFCQRFQTLGYANFWTVNLKEVDENFLLNCQNLQHVSFVNNSIEKIPENLFSQNLNLVFLEFSGTKLRIIPDKIFANQKYLKTLKLTKSKISNLNPKWFENLQNLEDLKMFNNEISEVPEYVFYPLISLQNLNLHSNMIQILLPTSFFHLQNLEQLNLAGNKIYDLPQNVFSSLRSLRDLHVEDNFLMTIHSDSFGIHPNLSSLRFEYNDMNAIDEKFIDSLPSIRAIDMWNNVCSRGLHTKREEMKEKLKKCFENYVPRKDIITTTRTTKASKKKTTISSTANSLACGKSKIGSGNIIGGNFITRGAFPWIAALVTNDGDFFCGGTLITNQKIISAAHCMQDKHVPTRLTPSDFKILLGVYDLKGQFEVGLKVAVVQKVHVHPDWNPKAQSFDADIAVLVIEEGIQFDNYIQPICLINSPSAIASFTKGVVVGFGKSEDETKRHETIPKILEIPIHENVDCFLKFSDLVKLSSRRTFCGGHADGTGVCSGDSGSGLVVQHNGAYYLRGIVSSSIRTRTFGCDVNAYSVFTDVLKYNDWINGIDVADNFYRQHVKIEERLNRKN